MKRILFTGGGTAGHVTPNLALMPHFLKNGWDVHYVGTAQGIERSLVEALPGVTYHAIHSGKLRRYFDIKNFTDPFRVVQGGFEASRLMGKLKPDVLFSKGGFVSVPVVLGAWLHHIPTVLHESDITPGLANKICLPMARTVCTTFPEAAKAVGGKAIHTGTPLRAELFQGDRQKGLNALGFSGHKPVLLVMGGSSGSVAINQALRESLDSLLPRFDIAHLCGKGHLNASLDGQPGYRQMEYASDGLNDLLAAADLMLSRAGANALSEILALKKPTLLVPYPMGASRGDQILNAKSFAKRGLARVLAQGALDSVSLPRELEALWNSRAHYERAMAREGEQDGTPRVIEIIERTARTRKE
ncbi:MAG: undecaprenyldiphospho-muramoylpentapeptide beta-N-acetylglucosaminyltransferase [Oscillospiraceae bacterium]|jgi:UDP-N-acetylglucosamine--N-acetylmuramyl-(pentapeptide) pyrophosphoryl-undecaprenol N-acetylglucosamine transferase|nr:undecaprenyldiphospho-muramoylpentapeptide beta-N-acetylglucosaminyltransferase [Oscillospiraceae bacterium]